MGSDGGGGQLHTDAAAAGGQAVSDADRGHFLDHGAGDGGDGAGGAGDREGGGRDRDRGDAGADAEVGGDGGGDVPQAAGRGAGGGPRGVPAGGDRQGRGGAGAGAGEAGVDQAVQEVQGGGVRADERGRGPAHAVLQRVPAAVLLSDDGRDGGVHVAGGDGDGDAGGQRDDEYRADHADRDGEGAAVRDPGGRADGGRGRRHRDRRLRAWRPSSPIRKFASASRHTTTIFSIVP